MMDMDKNAVTERARAQADAGDAPSSDIKLIGHVQVALSAQVGTLTMSIQDLFALKAGDVVTLNELLEAPLTLLLNDRPVARGELLAVDDHFGERVLELA